MTEEVRSTYPILSASQWRSLREKLKRSGIPTVINDTYLAAIPGITDRAATDFIIGLRALRLIDPDGRTGERVRRWRDDETYAEVCKEIMTEIYPEELLQAIPDPEVDRDGARRWFAKKTGAGVKHVNKMVALYVLLSEADPNIGSGDRKTQASAPASASQRSPSKNPGNGKSKPAQATRTDLNNRLASTSGAGQSSGAVHSAGTVLLPAIHLDIHIDAMSSPEQVEQLLCIVEKHVSHWCSVRPESVPGEIAAS